jgi:hypothetical protein
MSSVKKYENFIFFVFLYYMDNTTFVSSILGLIIIYLAYNYLNGLKNCDCVQIKSVNALKNIELLLLIISIGSFIVKLFSSKEDIKKMIKKYPLSIYAVYSLAIVVFSIMITYIYNFYNFYKKFKSDCNCAKDWKRYILYYQAFIVITNVILYSVIFILLFLVKFDFL